jgi:dTDP-4-dehydrorhamnose 3,5-epimerase
MNYAIVDCQIPDIKLLTERRFHDERGYFCETWSQAALAMLGLETVFIQDNESLSQRRGTVRGLHFQKAPFAQAKLVRVAYGAIYDGGVDIRRDSATFGRWMGFKLTAEKGQQLFIPKGFAHGFVSLVDDTIVTYKVDAAYAPASESGILWKDPDLGIDWPFPSAEVTISEKDRRLPNFKALSTNAY